MNETVCPQWGSNSCKKNGHIHNGKQNYRCKGCGRQFVLNNGQKIIPESTRAVMLKALLGRNSLLGICRIFSISLTWSLSYITEIYGQLPADLNFQPVANDNSAVTFHALETEADEIWGFVGNKKNKRNYSP